jgi:hypothetical protein
LQIGAAGNLTAGAFSSEVDAGSREENASKQKDRAPLRFNLDGKGSIRAVRSHLRFFDLSRGAIRLGRCHKWAIPDDLSGFEKKIELNA